MPPSHQSSRYSSTQESGSSQSDQTDYDLACARDAVLQELGPSIPQITFDDFLTHLAPPPPDTIDFNAIIQSLSSGSEPALVSGRWWTFPDNPKDANGLEDEIFKQMPEILTKVVDTIVPYLGENHKPTVDFLQNPNRAPISNNIQDESRPGGYLVLKDRESVVSGDKNEEEIFWADIALSFEYKPVDGLDELKNNVRKCIWSLQHVMRDDPRRRASFAMTIEKTTTRLWFCCRSWVVVSEPFDLIADPLKFVKFVAAFAFADYKSFGFDPTIQLVPETRDFVFTVHPEAQKPRRFKTGRTLSSHGAEPLRGRGTRVFEAVEIDENNNSIDSPVVLKDTWIDSDRMREGQIIASLHEAADVDDKKMIEELFLTTICHGDVLIDVNTVDDTKNALMRGLDIPLGQSSWFKVPIRTHGPIRKGSRSETLWEETCAQTPHPCPPYERKTHYRIVFKEHCAPIHDINDLNTVLEILKDIVKALRLLRKLGWVHRDVSTGNILSYKGHGKLADLEYAKKMGNSDGHSMRTGTMDFMAIEVATQEFLFLPSDEELDLFDLTSVTKRTASTKAPFFHNHLHDLESLWWVAVWVVFFNNFSQRTPSPGDPSITLQDVQSQIENARMGFPPTINNATRSYTFQTPRKFLTICDELPSNKVVICGILNQLRLRLIKNYKGIETVSHIYKPCIPILCWNSSQISKKS